MSFASSLPRCLFITAVMAAAQLAVIADLRSAESPAEVADRVAKLVERLSDDRFGVREDARKQLIALTSDAAQRDEAWRLLAPRAVDPQLPFEVREVLRALIPAGYVPPAQAVKPAPIATPSTAELNAWLDDLDAASFEQRERVATRLATAAEMPAVSGPLLWQIKQRLAKPGTSPDSLRRVRSAWEAALRTWVTANPIPWQPPPVTDDEIAAAIDQVIAVEGPPTLPEWLQPSAVAERNLLLFLSLDAIAPRVAALLMQRLEDPNLTPKAAGKLDRIYAWTRPAMAAEFWQAGRHHSTQHLLIGVPNQPDGAPRPSLFDRCDDRFAHCVSGNSLAPGDHPVGIFFPHPSEIQSGAQFHLVNLPTPRRRLAYEYEAPTRTSSAEELLRIDVRRRREITARTLARLAEEKRLLTEREITMLAHLDPVETARFAEKYLLNVADERYDSGSPQSFGNDSRHGWTCYILSTLAIPEAGRAVAAAIDKHRVLDPTEAKPYRIDWVAALNLAETAPWPEVDAWLAAQLDRTEAINIREPEAADVGASAAARLVLRAGRDLSEFSLEQHEFPELIDLENPGYRFTKPEGRATVKAWWQERQAAAGAKSP